MPDLLTLPRRPEVANTYDDFGQAASRTSFIKGQYRPTATPFLVPPLPRASMARAFCRALSEPYAEPADTYQGNPADQMKVPGRSATQAQVALISAYWSQGPSVRALASSREHPCPSGWSPLWTAMRVSGVKIPLPLGFIPPCLPSPSQSPPRGSAWVHEIKHDGYRLIARRDGNRVIAFGRILGLHGLGKECKSSGQRTPNHLIPRLVFCPFLPVRGIDPDQPPRFSVNPRIAYPAAREHEGMDCPVGFNDCKSQILVSRKVGKGIDVVPHAACRA